jgi:hypothetical protein
MRQRTAAEVKREAELWTRRRDYFRGQVEGWSPQEIAIGYADTAADLMKDSGPEDLFDEGALREWAEANLDEIMGWYDLARRDDVKNFKTQEALDA